MKIAELAAAVAAVSLLAGCTTVTNGEATKDPSFKRGDAIVSLLNPGNYPTAPKPGPALKQEAETGRIYDGERMGDYVVGPWEVDPRLLDVDATSTGLLLSAKVLSTASDEIAKKHQFIYGFGSARGTGSNADHPRGLQNLVCAFPTPIWPRQRPLISTRSTRSLTTRRRNSTSRSLGIRRLGHFNS